MFEEHVLNMTYTLWNMVDLLKFLHLIDGYLYLDEVEEHEDRYSVVISEKIQDDFKCFVIEILAINSSILYEKSKLTSTVLVDPYMEILFNTSLKTMDTGYLFLRDSKTLSSGLESRFLLEFNRSYLIGYETEEKIYEDGTRFETGCTNYSDIGFASRSHAVIDCELKATNDVAKKKCYGKYSKKDCQLTTYSPLLVSSKIHANKLRLAIQLNPEVTILTSKPRVDLAELFSFETGLIGFYLGINLIGIATFYRFLIHTHSVTQVYLKQNVISNTDVISHETITPPAVTLCFNFEDIVKSDNTELDVVALFEEMADSCQALTQGKYLKSSITPIPHGRAWSREETKVNRRKTRLYQRCVNKLLQVAKKKKGYISPSQALEEITVPFFSTVQQLRFLSPVKNYTMYSADLVQSLDEKDDFFVMSGKQSFCFKISLVELIGQPYALSDMTYVDPSKPFVEIKFHDTKIRSPLQLYIHDKDRPSVRDYHVVLYPNTSYKLGYKEYEFNYDTRFKMQPCRKVDEIAVCDKMKTKRKRKKCLEKFPENDCHWKYFKPMVVSTEDSKLGAVKLGLLLGTKVIMTTMVPKTTLSCIVHTVLVTRVYLDHTVISNTEIIWPAEIQPPAISLCFQCEDILPKEPENGFPGIHSIPRLKPPNLPKDGHKPPNNVPKPPKDFKPRGPPWDKERRDARRDGFSTSRACVKAIVQTLANRSAEEMNVELQKVFLPLFHIVNVLSVLNPANYTRTGIPGQEWRQFVDEHVTLSVLSGKDLVCYKIPLSLLVQETYRPPQLEKIDLLQPFLEFEIQNQRQESFYELYIHGNDVLPLAQDHRVVLYPGRTHELSYRKAIVKYDHVFRDRPCMDYGVGGKNHAKAECVKKGEHGNETRRRCFEKFKMDDCFLRTFKPVMVRKNSRNVSDVTFSLLLETKESLTTKIPKTTLSEFVTLLTGIVGFWFGFNLITVLEVSKMVVKARQRKAERSRVALD
ncbi:hypothetical protein HDE_12111 [Halotydeus destructor]|nr:hypothetical protein HDE_12111 [Halotydeus destructor]